MTPRRLPLTYGEFDRRNARWSPDGKRIAYISNESGNTSLWVQEVFGGARTPVEPQRLRYRTRPRLRPDPADGCVRQADLRARLGARQRWALACARDCLDARRRALRPRAISERSALLPLPGGSLPAASTCRPARRRFTCRVAFAGSPSRSSANSRPARTPSCRSASRTTTCRRSSASSSPPTCTCT